jgi:DNA invertase Pin-like site-specific DNA recombinase
MTAYGYIRKSVVHDPSRMLSPEMQEAAIRRLAAANGDEDVVILSDLDVSGRKGRSRRPGWDELLRAVEEGEAQAVYAYSLSRFARSVAQLADFFELCDKLKVRIRVDRDQIDTSTATGKLVGNVLASLAQFEADVASERVKDAFAAKRSKEPEWEGPGNRPYGSKPGEDAALVIEAFKEAGSFDGAARLLHDRGIPSRGRKEDGVGWWYGTTVRDIVRREAPDLVTPGTSRGSAAGTRAFRLARLLACSTCGTMLTGSYDRRHDQVNYYCRLARVTEHARGNVLESKILPGVIEEASFAIPNLRNVRRGSADDEARVATLAATRERWLEQYAEGLIDKAERDRRLAAIAEEESKLSAFRWVRRLTLPPDPATSDPGKVNSYLRRLFVSIEVDMSKPGLRGPSSWRPDLSFVWRDPSMRAEDWEIRGLEVVRSV